MPKTTDKHVIQKRKDAGVWVDLVEPVGSKADGLKQIKAIQADGVYRVARVSDAMEIKKTVTRTVSPFTEPKPEKETPNDDDS